ncbi:TetR/AcrR family transcriptional regulator [Streptomyces sp. KL116D]|uniref:TetR/AcrR family transcriptional regulator n=1 Tax=Streptomyces sp. KL116D TaxID=3045152 RepID=UPI003555CA87
MLTAAERLFAERGVYNVSNRQISEAAGQGNTTAVNYHFGNKTDLVRAISRRHTNRSNSSATASSRRNPGLHSAAGLGSVHGPPRHRAPRRPGQPTWYARFSPGDR